MATYTNVTKSSDPTYTNKFRRLGTGQWDSLVAKWDDSVVFWNDTNDDKYANRARSADAVYTNKTKS